MQWNRIFAVGPCLLLALMAHEARADAQALRYTPQERQISIALSIASDAEEKLLTLQQLSQTPDYGATRGQALIAQQQCDLAVRAGLDPVPYAKRLAQLVRQAGDQDSAPRILAQQCELRRLQYQDQPPALEKIWSHYRGVQGLGLPSVAYDVASLYSNLAHSHGLLDEALKASEAALAIAKANDDNPKQRSSLMDLAMIQADLGLRDEALRNSAAAVALGTGNNDAALLANRGYVQIRVNELDAAEATYQELLALTRRPPVREGAMLSGLVNLAHIYTVKGRVRENLAITAEAMTLARRLGLPADLGYAESARALALIADGQVDQARILFNEGQRHLEIGNESEAISGYLQRWAQQLGKRQLWEEAFNAAERARQLKEDANTAQRQKNGQYLSAILESAQKDQAIAELQQESRMAKLEAERSRAINLAWTLGLGALGVLSLALAIFYWRLRKANQKLNHENAHDPLTRLHNRLYFTRHFEERASQAQGGRAIVALLDIDHFKHINDTWGHAVGDQVLQQIGTCLRSALRSNDLIARWGGEEIAVFVDDLHPKLRARDFAERLRNTLAREPLQVAGQDIPVTASIGYVEFKLTPDAQLDRLLEVVDSRLYAAKRWGRNRAVGDEVVQLAEFISAPGDEQPASPIMTPAVPTTSRPAASPT